MCYCWCSAQSAVLDEIAALGRRAWYRRMRKLEQLNAFNVADGAKWFVERPIGRFVDDAVCLRSRFFAASALLSAFSRPKHDLRDADWLVAAVPQLARLSVLIGLDGSQASPYLLSGRPNLLRRRGSR